MVEEADGISVPRRLGRYDVVGVLSMRRGTNRSTVVIGTARNASSAPPSSNVSSGLALSYSPLAPHEGTTTFQKPVAIKCVAPALLSDPEVVAAFLEAARAATGLRHSNVVQIREVGHVGTDLFLVMDYLMGESAATLMRHLHSQGATLDFTLAAHIIAEASAGLEAGHALGLLHEQLTPHDLFIGYDGSVRVLDIGIAAARRRMAGEPEGGRLEREYTSPEHCRLEPIDRRSDVFSLGTMLWELITGISPFERAKEADTRRAICEEAIVSPTNLVSAVPDRLSDITMTALERDKGERYPTALALRQALLDLQDRSGTSGSVASDLGGLMTRLFETRIRDKREMLTRINAGASIAGLAIGEPEETAGPSAPRGPSRAPPPVEDKEPSVIIAPPSSPKLVASVPAPPPPPAEVAPPESDEANADAIPGLPAPRRPSPPRHSLVWAFSLVLVIVGSGLAAMALQGRLKSPPTRLPSSAALPVVAGTQPATDIAVPPPSSTSDTALAPAEEALLHIETIPTHAAILIAGTKKGFSPLDLKVPKGTDVVVVEIRHAGYQTMKERVVPDVNQRLKLTLVAARDPGTAPVGSVPYRKFE